MELLQIELNKLQLSQQTKCLGAESKLCWSDFTSIVARKAMLIGLMLAILNQLCGCFALINYTATICQESGSNLSPNASAIVIGAIQFFGAYVSTLLVDRAGRKVNIERIELKTDSQFKYDSNYLFTASDGFFGGCNQFGFSVSRHLYVPEIHRLSLGSVRMGSHCVFLVRLILCVLGRFNTDIRNHFRNFPRKGTLAALTIHRVKY